MKFLGKFRRKQVLVHHEVAENDHPHAAPPSPDTSNAEADDEDQANSDPDTLQPVVESGLFDAAWYLYRYPDVATFPGGGLNHFCRHGLEELRAPSPYISPANYLRRFPKAKTSTVPAFLHALANLKPEERERAWMPDDDESLGYLMQQSNLFDEAWYLERNRDVGLSGLRPIQHFLCYGAHEGRDPGPAFDTDFYRENHPGFEDDARTAIEHFVRIGMPLGYAGVGRPKYERWLAAFDALTQDDMDHIASDRQDGDPAITAFHVIDADALGVLGRIIGAWTGQVGALFDLRLVRGDDVSEPEWATALSRIGERPHVSVASAGPFLAGLPDGAIVLLCAGPTLMRPHAAYVLSNSLRAGSQAVYADHTLIDSAGARTKPFFKPVMSPEYMKRLPYAGAVVGTVLRDGHRAILSEAIEAATRGEPEKAWAAYLLALPVEMVARAPFLLFQQVADIADLAMTDQPGMGLHHAARPIDADDGTATEPASVSIVIPTRDRCELLRDCIESIGKGTDYPSELIEIVVVDNDSEETETLSYFAELDATKAAVVVRSSGPFNFSQVCNAGAASATGQILVFLNNDMVVKQRDWLQKLVHFAGRPTTGVVGAQLLYPDDTVQHGGVVLGIQGVGAHYLIGVDGEQAAKVDVTRELVAVTGACLSIRRLVFDELGGFDPILAVAFNDVKLCAEAYAAGYRNMYVAEPLFYHHESKSRGFDGTRLRQQRNLREATYVRERFSALFRDDPYYSPNLSLQKIGDVATPPRIIRPWRRSRPGQRRMLLLSRVHGLGHGVAKVVLQQALMFRDRGWDVIIGGPMRTGDAPYRDFQRANLWTAETAAAYAVENGIDCVVAHTPPFFSVARFLGSQPLLYFVDHGEPAPRLFPDWQVREAVDWEKRFCAPLAKRVFTISHTIYNHQFRADAQVIRNGNSHLASWSVEAAARRRGLRARLGLEGCFVILNVCRFGEGERLYKGIDRYGAVASDLPYRHPELAGKVRFLLAGQGKEEDVAEAQAMNLVTFANISDAELIDLYVASDLYMNLSEWEGYNLGIGQALAMGLDVVASDIEAHREFTIETLNSVPEFCASVARRFETWDEDAKDRRAVIEAWDAPLRTMAELVEGDVAAIEPSWP